MSKTFTKADVATHKDEAAGMYIIIDDGVYNITGTAPPPFPPSPLRQILTSPRADFLEEHPGGAKILKRVAGKDATKQFWKYHGKSVLEKYGANLKVGTVAETAKL